MIQAFISPQALGAVACMLFFWCTISSYDSDAIKSPASSQKVDLHDAADIIERAEALKPMVLLKQGKSEEAMNAANALLKAQGHTDALANICVGDVFIANNLPEDGLRCLKNGVGLAHRNKFAMRHYAQKLAACGRKDDSLVQYQNLIKIDPNWDLAHLELAQLYMANGQNAEAAAELKTACEIDDKNFDARKLRGIALAKSGDMKAGLDDYVMASALENRSGIPEILKPLLGAQGNGAIARATYELQQQLNQRPDDYLPKLRLAQLYAYSGNAKDAKELLVEARRQAPNNPEVHRTLALVLKQLGEETAALSSFGLSVKLEDQQNAHKQ